MKIPSKNLLLLVGALRALVLGVNVTSASFASSAPAIGAKSAAQSKTPASPAHAHEFSKMLNEGLKRNKEDHAKPAANLAKDRKTEADSGNETAAAPETMAAVKQVVKPPVTAKIEVVSQDRAGRDAPKAELPEFPANVEPQNLNLETAETVLSSTGLNKDAGSILMALMMQSRSGDLALPQQADTPEHIEDKQNSTVDNPAVITPVMVPVAFAHSLSNSSAVPQSSNAVERAGTQVESVADSDDEAPKAAAAAVPGHLAFALRLNAALSSSSLQAFSSTENTVAPPALSEITLVNASPVQPSLAAADSESGNKEHAGDHSDNTGAPALVDVSTFAAVTIAEKPFSMNEVPAAAPPPEVDERLQEYSNEPVHNVHMQVVGEDQTRVDIRLMDRAGELRVSVKSADSLLNRNLQEQMPELTSRLESARYETEVWMPSSPLEKASAKASVNASGTAGSPPSRPSWVEALEGSTPQSIERMN